MSVGLLCPSLDAGPLPGIDREVVEIANALSERGCDVVVAAPHCRLDGAAASRPESLKDSVQLVRLRSVLSGAWPLQNASPFLAGLRTALRDVDLVIVFNVGWPITLRFGHVFSKWQGEVWYRTYWHPLRGRSPLLDGVRTNLFLRVLRRADLLVVPTQDEALQLGRLLGDGPPMCVVPPGATSPQPQLLASRKNLRKELGIDPDALLLVQVGRPSAFKGTDLCLGVLVELRRRGGNAHLAIVGEPLDPTWLDDCIDGLGVRDRVLLFGHIDDGLKDSIFTAGDVALVLSEYEGFGFVALEALAHRLPVVLYDDFPSSSFLAERGATLVRRGEPVTAIADAVEHAHATKQLLPSRIRTWGEVVDDLLFEFPVEQRLAGQPARE